MSEKCAEIAIRELTKTVLSLQSKVNSMEKVLSEQNLLIKKLISLNKETVQSKSNITEGTTILETTIRPMREAHIRAASAISANTRKRTVKPAPTTTGRAVTPSAVTPTPSAPSTPQLAVAESGSTNALAPNTDDDTACKNADDWIEVRHRRNRRSLENVVRGTAVPESSSLLAAERKSYLHLYYVKVGTTVDQVTAHLKTICNDDICSAEALKPRGDYASFKLTVPTKHVNMYMSPENWVEDVCIKPWRSGFRKHINKTPET
ncbi:hypothetical protein PYW07_016859 [Mythimna separata]|uniref:Uncharacterized protein n=1 Tax=Mythimna separata TaxID=271217 RepID=A0AAD7YUC4_MYTSE|nr:hypothetical protein PYW07_016859 [Mythimna separata]